MKYNQIIISDFMNLAKQYSIGFCEISYEIRKIRQSLKQDFWIFSLSTAKILWQSLI